MMDEPLYKVSTACTLSQYQRYNRTVQRYISKVNLRIWAVVALDVAAGAAFSVLFGSPFHIVFFVAIGALYAWMSFRQLRKAEMLQYQQEQLAGTITYLFFKDRFAIQTQEFSAEYPYSSVKTVIDVPEAFYIMISDSTGAIVPKEDCPEGLESFIRSSLSIRTINRPVSVKYRGMLDPS